MSKYLSSFFIWINNVKPLKLKQCIMANPAQKYSVVSKKTLSPLVMASLKKALQESSLCLLSKEYMDVATGEDNVCLSPVEESNEVEKVIIEPDIVAVDAGLVQQTPDSVLPRKEFCDVAVGEGKICDIVCDTCHNKKLKTYLLKR